MRSRIACAAGVTGLAGAEEADRLFDRAVEHLGDVELAEPVLSTDAWNRRPSQSSQTVLTPAINPQIDVDHPAPLQAGQAPRSWR